MTRLVLFKIKARKSYRNPKQIFCIKIKVLRENFLVQKKL
uniref:Uncharacterized protein n=1 Tax=viral metagenome TaxID=1070528 RepID=A0A6C0BC71_9ZZZZ